jgi:hypothetical protein
VSFGCLNPHAKWTSSPLPLKLRAQGVKITCEAEYRSLSSLENVTTSVHCPVQSGLFNRAQSKII